MTRKRFLKIFPAKLLPPDWLKKKVIVEMEVPRYA